MLLIGCSEKQEYERIVFEQMKSDKDVKDYNIDPEAMSKCVVETSSGKMPGLMAFDPKRKDAYKNYSKMLELNKSEDPKKTLEELRVAFGSPKALSEAHANYAESIVDCMSGMVTSTEIPTGNSEK